MSRKKTSTALRAKRSKHARSNKPRLHPELESMVLDTFQHFLNPQDLTWLWVGGRHVSKHFRCEIERIFRTVFIPETILRCYLGKLSIPASQVSVQQLGQAEAALTFLTGTRAYCWDVFSSGPQAHAGCRTNDSTVIMYDHQPARFTLDRFSDDHTRAFFKCEEYIAPKEIVFRRLHEKQLVGGPVFSIQVREVVNDTGLPNLQIDDENEEISFDWRGMLDQLMGEEHVFNTILSQRLGWHLDTGEDTPNILETHRKLARRSRLQRECRAKYRSNILDHYVYDETSALENLQYLRFKASNSRSTYNEYKENKNSNNLVYTKEKILFELPEGTIIYSGNPNPGPKPGSIPRGLFTEHDYCSPSKHMPPPSAADLFSPRPLPELSWGRRPMTPTPKIEQKHHLTRTRRAREEKIEQEYSLARTKRVRDEDTETVSMKRRRASTD